MKRLLPFLLFPMLALVSCAGQQEALRPDRAEQIVTHEVRYGESWESIAGDFYGDGSRAAALASYNGGDPQRPPEPGSGIRIPLTGKDIRTLESKLEAADLYNEGLDLASSGNYAGAVERFRIALERDPRFADASFNLAVTYQKLGLHDKASTVLESLVMRHPENPDYLFALGHSYFRTGAFDRAEKSFLGALSIDPDHLKSLFALATVYEREGKIEEARNRFAEYIIRDSGGEWAEEARSRLERLNKTREGER
jgi:tetratricopeptide (TPR) repeat protein